MAVGRRFSFETSPPWVSGPRGAELATLLSRVAAVSESLLGNWCDTLARVVDRYGV